MTMTTILMIEDALDLAALVRRELEAEGYVVRHAADGQAGVEAFHTAQPDLVLLDWMLPKLDGLAVLRRIRQTPGPLGNVPVLMLTARGEEMDRVDRPGGGRRRLSGQAVRYARVGGPHPRPAAAGRERAGGARRGPHRRGRGRSLVRVRCASDPDGYEATLDGEALDLTRTEFDLLALLVRNPGRAFSRQYLLDTVWGADYVTGDRSVDNAILRLRKKLGPLGDAVETVWGVGYRWRRMSKPGSAARRIATATFFLTAAIPPAASRRPGSIGLLLCCGRSPRCCPASNNSPRQAACSFCSARAACGACCGRGCRPAAGSGSSSRSQPSRVALSGGHGRRRCSGPAQLSAWWQERIATIAAANGGELHAHRVLFAATGAGYFVTRLVLRLLLFWNRLRRRRLVWSITNAHLVLVAVARAGGRVHHGAHRALHAGLAHGVRSSRSAG